MYFWRGLVGLCDSAAASAELSGTGQEFTVVGRVVDDLVHKCRVKTSQKDVKVRLPTPSAAG